MVEQHLRNARRHDASGRHELWVGTTEAGVAAIWKAASPGSKEAWFYGRVRGRSFNWLPECLNIGGNGLTIRHLEEARPLADVGEPLQVLARLAALGPVLAELHALAPGADAPNARPLMSLDPVPSQVLSWASGIVVNLLQGSQSSAALVRADALCRNAPVTDKVVVHGDLKVDNVLVYRNRQVLIDFDGSGLGLGWQDLAAVLGSMVEVWLRSLRGDADTLHETISWPAIQAAADALLTAYGRERIGVRLDTLWAGVALWLVWRAVAMVSYGGRAAAWPADVRLATAEWIAQWGAAAA